MTLAWCTTVALVMVVGMSMGMGVGASTGQQPRGLAIDLGSEWLKVAVVAPATGTMQAVEVAVDEQSERRTPALVAFDPPPAATGRLLAGVAAARAAARRPDSAVPALVRLLGVPLDATSYARDFAHHFPAPRKLVADTERGGAAIIEEPLVGRPVRIEEAAARLFELAKELGGGQEEMEVVVTVPSYYTTAQRRLLSQVITLAGLKPLALVNDLTAVAVDYASTRLFPSPSIMIFFGVGAHAASASVVELVSGANGKTYVDVLGTASELDVGGLAWDVRLSDHLAKSISGTLSSRALYKLRKHAQQIKEELSSVQSVDVHIENIHDGTDLHTTVSRDVLEELVADLLPRAASTIERALVRAGVKLSDVSGIELFGGAARFPKLQEIVRAKYNLPLGQHINGDEAAVLGAATQLVLTKGWGHLISTAYPRIVVQDLEAPQPMNGQTTIGELQDDVLAEVKRGLEQFAVREGEYQEAVNWRNILESSIIEQKNQLEDSEQAEDLKEQAAELLRSAEEWLEDLSESVRADELKAKYDELTTQLKTLTPDQQSRKDEL